MLGIQFIQKPVSQIGQAVLLGQLILFLLMAQGCLANQQDNQQNKAYDQEQRGHQYFIIHNSQ